MKEVKSSPSLQENLATLPKDDINSAIVQGLQIAKNSGFTFNKKLFLEFTQSQNSDKELENIAGGCYQTIEFF